MKKVIYVYGASGAGVSTLGRAIAEGYGYRQLDTDDYFWLPTDPPFVRSRERSDRVKLLRADLDAAEKAVISGSLYDWGDVLLTEVTLGVRVVTPTEVRIQRLRRREYARFGERIREGGDMFKDHLEFIEWAKGYDFDGPDTRSKQGHDREEKLLTCPKIQVDGTRPVEEILAFINEFSSF